MIDLLLARTHYFNKRFRNNCFPGPRNVRKPIYIYTHPVQSQSPATVFKHSVSFLKRGNPWCCLQLPRVKTQLMPSKHARRRI